MLRVALFWDRRRAEELPPPSVRKLLPCVRCWVRQITSSVPFQKIAQTCGISKAAISKALLNLGAEYATFDEVEKERKALEVASTVGDRVYHEAHFHHQLAHAAPQPISSPYNSPV